MINITDKVEIAEDVLKFLKEVNDSSTGYDIYLGGGYLRDKYVGKTPKDVDVFVIPNGEEKDLHIPPRGYNNYIKDASSISDMQERGVKKVRGDWYSKMSTPDVQFIIYQDPMTIKELAEDMDINLCQVMYSAQSGEVLATEAFITGHFCKIIECLHDYDTVRTYKRYVRMEDKFYDYHSVGKPELGHFELERLAETVEHSGSFCEEDLQDGIIEQEGVELW